MKKMIEPAPETPHRANLHGYLDGIKLSVVSGWALDLGHRDAPCLIDVYVDCFDTDRLADDIKDMVGHPTSMIQMRKNARVRAFDFERRSWPRLRQLMRDVVSRDGRPKQ